MSDTAPPPAGAPSSPASSGSSAAPSPGASTRASAGDRLVRLGGVVLVVGMIALVVVLALAAGGHRVPTAVVSLALLGPAGFLLGLIGLVFEARARRRI